MATRIADNPKIWGRTPSQGPELAPDPNIMPAHDWHDWLSNGYVEDLEQCQVRKP
jgi:hypothetical protein